VTSTLERPAAQDTQWFATWFDSPHYHRLYGYRDASEAAGFVDALLDRLHPAPRAEALDLGCGAGRHARHLASKGLQVTGVDLSAGSIAQARRFERPGLRFQRHDMREPLGTEAFDYVFNFFTSFGYFADPAEHRAVVANIAHSLRDGGTLVLDYLNVGYAEQRQTPEELKIIDDVRFRLTRWSDARWFYKRIEITDGAGAPLEYVEQVAKFTVDDFRALFAPQDLEIEEVCGDYRLNAYDAASSPRLILIARKRVRTTSAAGTREVLPNAA
jgi:SAM-dependent methyltransferase